MNTCNDDPLYRKPPHNLEAEQALLGAILVNNRALERASDILEPQHFFDPLHRQIFEAMAKLITGNRLVTPTTLKPFFENSEPIREMSVAAYPSSLALNATTIVNVPDYARVIRDLAIRRQLIWIGETMVNAAYDSPVDFPPKEQIEEAERRLYGLAEHGENQSDGEEMDVILDRVSVAIRHARENPGANVGVATELVDVDRKLGGGLQPSDLIIVAGRPAMGKTGLAGTIARNVNVPTHIFSLEMTSEQIVMRLIAAELSHSDRPDPARTTQRFGLEALRRS